MTIYKWWRQNRLKQLALAKQLDSFSICPRYRPIPGFNNYRVGDDGTVWCFRWDRRDKGRWKQLKGTKMKSGGHRRVQLHDGNGLNRMVLLHVLVLEIFVGPQPAGKYSCHWDDNPENNQLSNLRWGTRKDNATDRKRNRQGKGLSSRIGRGRW